MKTSLEVLKNELLIIQTKYENTHKMIEKLTNERNELFEDIQILKNKIKLKNFIEGKIQGLLWDSFRLSKKCTLIV